MRRIEPLWAARRGRAYSVNTMPLRVMTSPSTLRYTAYDRAIASRVQIWLHEEAPKWRDRPWVLFVSFVTPHFPLTAPPQWFYHYWRQALPMPKLYAQDQRPHHPRKTGEYGATTGKVRVICRVRCTPPAGAACRATSARGVM